MVVISRRQVRKWLFAFLLILSVVGGWTLSKNELLPVNGGLQTYTIVVDAGHGKPDGGAVSKDGVEEEALNLAIAQKLREALERLGFTVVMTRETHESIASLEAGKTVKAIKTEDLEKRVEIANLSGADFMISIHMNKFEQSSSWGWQTFYSKGSVEGKRLAELVQCSLSKVIDRPNHRSALPIEGIKIVDHTTLPVVIVECGFLSNPEDLRLLQTEEYQDKIVQGIVMAIEAYDA